jgi:hypothetical protein
MASLLVQIQAVNQRLRAFGREAIQEIKMTDKEGNLMGKIKYGYRPQYVFDSVNEVIGPENWRYELTKEDILDNQAIAEVRLFFKVDNEWLCKGSHKGQMQIIKNNVGDAQKGAITDAIQKCMSLVSIGSDAYKGLLVHLYQQGNQPPQSLPAEIHEVSTLPSYPMEGLGLPKIAGISYENRQGVIVAIGEHLYDKKELLKAAGFRWDKTVKNWMKQAA